jgi:hypothetical protein
MDKSSYSDRFKEILKQFDEEEFNRLIDECETKEEYAKVLNILSNGFKNTSNLIIELAGEVDKLVEMKKNPSLKNLNLDNINLN